MGVAALALLVAAVVIVAALASRGAGGAAPGTDSDEAGNAPRPVAVPKPTTVSRPAAPPGGAAAGRRAAGHVERAGGPPAAWEESAIPPPPSPPVETRQATNAIVSAPGRFSFADMVFSNHADAVLGNLLTMEDGDDLVGDPDEAYKGFAAAFDKAMEQPIAIGDEDDDFQRELKEAVIELREELARRRADGEDIEGILAESWRQMKELSLFRREIESQVGNMLDEGMTQEDYESLVGEANRILAEEGVKPLELPATLKRALRIRRLQAEAMEEEAMAEGEEAPDR